MTAYCPSPLLMNRPANINTSLHYPLSLPSNLVQPSSPSLSRSKVHNKKQSASFSSSSSTPSSTSHLPAPSRLAAFLASLLPLPATASSADHERVKHRHATDLLFPAASAAPLERELSSADLTPVVSFVLGRCVMEDGVVQALMRGLASHTALQALAFEQCGDGIDALAIVRQFHTLPALTSLSFWSTSLATLHKHDMHTILSLPTLTSLNVASSGLPLHSLQSIVSSLSSPSSHLTHVDLSNTGCDLSVAHLLAASLPSNAHLVSLVLHSNRLGRDGVLAICSSLTSNTVLSHLDLRWNRLFAPTKAEAAASASVASVSLDTLVSSLQSNTALTTLLLCGHADPAASNLQSAVDIFTQRNRAMKQPLPYNNNNNSAAAEAVVHQRTVAPHMPLKKDSLSMHDNPLQLSPPLESRSYSHSLSAASPFSLSLEPIPSSSAASEPASSPAPVSPSSVSPRAPSTVDARLSSVVLQQEQEIGRQSKVISRLRAMVKKQEDTIKSTKAQLRNSTPRLSPRPDASPPLPPRPTTPRTPASNGASEPWTPLSALSPSAATDSSGASEAVGGGAGGSTGGVSMSPPLGASPRGSFTLGEAGSAGGVAEEEEGGGGREFRVNLDLAATVVLLEQEKNSLLEEMKQSIKAQEAAAAAAAVQPPTPNPPTPTFHADAEEQAAAEHSTSTTSSTAVSPSDGAASASTGTGVVRSRDDERGRLVAEVADLRQQVARLQQQVGQTDIAGRPPGLRRDSANHAAALLAAARAEGERAVRERDEKIRQLLSAQRVLAESREVQSAAMRREWRETERQWKEEKDRMKEEIRRLRRRNNRLSNDPKRDRPLVLVSTGSPKLQHQTDGDTEALDTLQSPSSASSCSSTDTSDDDHSLSSSQPLPSSSADSAPPALPPKPVVHNLGSVIAARIAALKAHQSPEDAGRTKQARSVEEPKRDRKKSRRARKREADDKAAEQSRKQSVEQDTRVEHHDSSGKEAQEEKVAS